MELELDYGELAPPVSYETAHVSLVAMRDYVKAMPVAALDADEVVKLIDSSVSGLTALKLAFAEYIARGGIDDTLARHQEGGT